MRGLFRTRSIQNDVPIDATVIAEFGGLREWLEVSADGRSAKVEAPRFMGRFGPDLEAAATLLSASRQIPSDRLLARKEV